MKSTTSLLDPIPNSFFKSCFDALCPAVLSIINDSLQTGVIPAALKIAAVTSVPKKEKVALDYFNNFRPTSKLKNVARFWQNYLSVLLPYICVIISVIILFDPFQSGFRKFLQYWDCFGQGRQWFVDGFWLWCNICSYASWSKSRVWYRAVFVYYLLLLKECLVCLGLPWSGCGLILLTVPSVFLWVVIGLWLALSQLVSLRGRS